MIRQLISVVYLGAILPVLLGVPCARADSRPGVNMYLDKAWATPAVITADKVQTLADLNDKRIAIAHSDGFTLIRLLVSVEKVRPEASQQERNAVLSLISRFAQDANASGIHVIVALFPDSAASKHQLVCAQSGSLFKAADVVAAALRDNELDGVEPMNEPHAACGSQKDGTDWDRIQEQLIRNLRARYHHLTLVVSAGDYGTLDGLLKLSPAAYRRDDRVLFSFHYYEPPLFTHQGASFWFPGAFKYVRDLQWPYEAGAVRTVRDNSMRQLDADQALDEAKRADFRRRLDTAFQDYAQDGTNAYIASRFDHAAGWARANGIAPDRLFVGEFGVLRPDRGAHGKPQSGAAEWITAVARASRNRGFEYAAFDLDTTFAVDCARPAGDESLCDEFGSLLR